MHNNQIGCLTMRTTTKLSNELIQHYSFHEFLFCLILLKISLETTFFVVFNPCSSSCPITILKPSILRTRDRATYNWPWVKTGLHKYKPTFFSDCPWRLLMVIAKDKVIGNCLHCSLKGHLDSDGFMSIIWRSTFSFGFESFRVIALITVCPSLDTSFLIYVTQ